MHSFKLANSPDRDVDLRKLSNHSIKGIPAYALLELNKNYSRINNIEIEIDFTEDRPSEEKIYCTPLCRDGNHSDGVLYVMKELGLLYIKPYFSGLDKAYLETVMDELKGLYCVAEVLRS